jgi:hypothetical protein
MLTIKDSVLTTLVLLFQIDVCVVLTLLYLALAIFQTLSPFSYVFKPFASPKKAVRKESILDMEPHLKIDYKPRKYFSFLQKFRCLYCLLPSV